ncbi:aspartate/glutamate racemase family protein [Micromonospora pattaloongensis]|nr:amino acid racemase [Micromonospora pattaloongensis]
MRRLGLLGGMSWESSIEYERTINELVRDRLGGVASADLLIRSFNFADIEALQESGRWDEAGRVLAEAAANLAAGGAHAIVICTNTMHRLADTVQAAVPIPVIHIADATAAAVKAAGVDVVALLGTRYTMEQDFYVGRLRERHGLTVLVPGEPGRTRVHEVIYGELVRGVINPDSKQAYLDVIGDLLDEGAQGVIAGCTEIELLIGEDDLPVPMFPTARIHAEAAVKFALDDA